MCEASSHNSNNNNNILRGRARNNNNNNDDKPLLPRPLTHHQDDDAVVASRFYPAHLARVSLVLLSPRPRGLLALDALPPTATTNTSVDNTTTMTTSSSSSCQDYVALGFDCGDTCHDASNNTTSSSSSSFQCRYSNNIKEEDEEVWVEQHDTVVVVAQQPEEETENATNTSTSTTTTTSTTKITTTTTITTFQSVTSCQQATPTTTTTTAATSSSSHIICSTTHSNETLQEQGSSPLFLQAAGIGRTYTCELRLQNQLCHTCEMSVCGEGGEEGASSSSTMMQIAQFDCTNIQDGRQGNLCWGDAITITAEEEEEESSSIVEEEDGRSEEDTLIVPTATSVAPVPTATTATTSAAAPTTTYVMAPPVAVVGPTYTSPVIISSSSTEEAKAETAPTATTTTGTATTTNMTVTVTPVNASAVPVLDETTAPVAVDTAAPVTVDTAAPVAEGDATSTTAPAFDTMAPQVGDATSTTAPEVDTMAPEAGDATSTSAPVSLTLAPIDRTDDQPSVPIPVHPFQELCQFYDKHALGCKCPNLPDEQVPVDVSSMDCVKTQSSCSIDPSTSLQVCLNETVDFDTSSENGGGVSSFQVQSCYHVSTVPPTSYCILKTVTVPPAMLVNKENDQSLPPPLPPIMVPPAPVGGTSCQLQVNDQVCESCVYGRCPGQQTSEEDSIVAFDCTNTDVKTIGSECQGSVVFPLLATVTLPSILSSQEDGTVVATPPTLEPQFQSGSLTSPPVGVVGTEAPTLIDATWEPTQLSAITWAPTMVDTVDDVRGRTSAAGGAADVSGLLQEGQEMVDVSVSSSMEESSAKPTRNRSNYLIVSSFAMMVVVSAWLW